MSVTPASNKGHSHLPSARSGKSLLHKAVSVLKGPVLLASVAVTALLVGARHQGVLERLELGAFDQSLRMRPALTPDPRILVVTIAEADIQTLHQWPISDGILQKLLSNLEQLKPRVIGLDMYRDVPVEPGHKLFAEHIQKSDRIIPACKVSEGDNPGVPPPPGVPQSRAGFIDLLVDPSDGIVRRGLLFLKPPAKSACQTKLSFAFQLAQHYLEKEGIQPARTKQDNVQLGKAIFKPLSDRAGGYQDVDTRGFQILLNYRSPDRAAPEVTLTQVLNGQVQPSLVKDRIVLIGVTAPSANDAFNTPYSASQERHRKMPGVFLHAQITSQIVSAALDGQPMFWFWPEWAEALWIWVWSLAGGMLVWRLRRPEHSLLAGGIGIGVLVGTSWILFTQAGWVPVVPPTLALVFTGSSVMGYRTYQTRKEQEKIVQQAREQQEIIAQLNALLKKETNSPTAMPRKPLSEDETQEGVLPARDEETLSATAFAENEETLSATAFAEDEETLEATALASSQDTAGNTLGISSSSSRSASRSSSLLKARYKIMKVLGAGGFGLTFLAEDTQRPGNPLCVVKQLRPARTDEKFLNLARRLFRTEADILEKLGKHNQIPQLLAYFEENEEFYLVQELIDGHALSDELPVDKRLPEAQVVDILRGVLEILAFIHEHGVIHRDIKPSNIIRRHQDSRLVLIDFGAVKEIQPQESSELENLTVVIGTRGYTPPEQLHGRPRLTSDIYAVGMIGIQALTGIHPHQLPQDAITGDICWRNLAKIEEGFAQVIDKMVRYHFVERYQSATEVLQDLKRLGI